MLVQMHDALRLNPKKCHAVNQPFVEPATSDNKIFLLALPDTIANLLSGLLV
jgi:hypothetical protein